MKSFTLTGRIARGFGAQSLSMAFEISHRFLTIPLYLSAWPVELYGDWLVIQAAAMLVPLADLGIMPYFSNAMAMAWARGDRAAFDRLLRTAFGLYALLLGVAAPVYMLAILLTGWAGGFTDGAIAAESRASVWLMLGLYHISAIPQGVLIGIYRARTSFALEVQVVMLKDLFLLVMTAAALLLLEASPVQLAATLLTGNVLVYGPIIADQQRRYSDLRYGFALPTRAEFRSYLGYLRWFTVVPILERLFIVGPILVLGLVASEAAVVVFSTLRILSGIIRTGVDRIALLAGAEMAPLYACSEMERLTRLYAFTGRLAMGLAGFAAGASYALAEPFLAIWIGGKVSFDAPTMAALLMALVCASHGQICIQLLRFTNRVSEMFPWVMGRVLIGLGLGGVLGAAYGAAGMAVGLMVGEVALMGLLLPLALHRTGGLPFWPFLARNFGSAVPAFAASFATALGLLELIGGQDLLRLAVVGALWAVPMVPLALFLLLDADQRTRLRMNMRASLRRTAGLPFP